MDDLFTLYRNQPLTRGWNSFLENDAKTQLDFGLYWLEPGETQTFVSQSQEIALLILGGKGSFETEKDRADFERSSWIEQSPCCVHSPVKSTVAVTASTEVEIAVVRTMNPQEFPQKIYRPEDVECEHRGKGMLDDASYRIVRCVFDRRTAPPESRLVLGEVINFPGRWSSYPPHHHTQPELYYYRFEPEWGYGHGELGDTVYKIKHHEIGRAHV